MNAAQTSVQRFSCAVIWPRSKRRCRVETLILPNLVNRTIQTTSITSPIASATHGYAVLSIGERSEEPAQAAIGTAQMTLLIAAKPVRP